MAAEPEYSKNSNACEQKEEERLREPILACLICHKCSELAREPHVVIECLHRFCLECIRPRIQLGSGSNCCPCCNTRVGPDPFHSGQIKFDAGLNELSMRLFPHEGDAQIMAARRERLEQEKTARPVFSRKHSAVNTNLSENNDFNVQMALKRNCNGLSRNEQKLRIDKKEKGVNLLPPRQNVDAKSSSNKKVKNSETSI
mmetsp:Transcript_39935/g.55519  ORF Transcript_39935/g.55519 Transcript_39935/m.55519 type:complete len:200 (+) Transcript_39935:60-659(+)